MPRNWDDLFWAALALVAGLVVVMAAKSLFRDHNRPRRARWLPVAAGLLLMLPGACAHVPAPVQAASPACGTGWTDCGQEDWNDA